MGQSRHIVKLLSLAILTLAIASLAAAKDAKPQRSISDGKAILRECSLALDVNVYHPRKLKKRSEAFDLGYCLGLVEGIYANISGRDFCPPDNVGTPRVLELTVNFVKSHPELQDKDGADIVRWALSDEFPCPDKSHPKEGDGDTEASAPQ